MTNYGRLRRIRSSASSGVPLAEWRYNYDLAGNVTRAVDVPREASNWPTSGFSFADTFDSKSTSNWTWSAYQTVPFDDSGNKVVKSSGTGSSWDAHFYRAAYSLSHGEGLQVRFKVDQTNTLAHFSIEANDVAYLRFGARAENGRLIVQYNDSGGYRYPVDLLTNLQLNTWYVLRIAVDDSDRGFYVEAYQESAPTVRGSFNVYMPTGKTWRFHHWIYRGNAYLDDYREFTTGGLAWTPDEREALTYDALDRLVGGSPVSGAQGYTVTYGYDPTGNITYATGLGTYVYTVTVSGCSAGTRSAKPHAVGRAGSNTYVYDCTGNVTRRVELSGTQVVTYYQEYDAENRLVAVTNTVTSLVTRFAYDGDGQRVKVTVGTTTTVYVGTYYEQRGSTVTRYYYLGGQRVAMQVGPAGQAGTVSYLHADHLGSTSLATSSSGGMLARQRYYPYGAVRPGGTGTLPTDYTFTGQKDVPGTGLMYYGARYYEPALGRFVSADTIVPEPGSPQSLNRYSYVYNNPLRYVDPTGYYSEDEIMRFLGLDPEKDEWENALAFFEAGGSLEGRWGWLAVLRRANDGSQVGSSENAIDGTFVTGAGGRLYVQTPAGEFLAHETVAMAHDTYFVRYTRPPLVPRFPPGYRMPCMFTTSAYQREDSIRLIENRLDMASIWADTTSLFLSLTAGNTALKGVNITTQAGSSAIGLSGATRSLAIVSPPDYLGAGLNIASAIPGPVGTIGSVACLVYDYSKGLYYGP